MMLSVIPQAVCSYLCMWRKDKQTRLKTGFITKPRGITCYVTTDNVHVKYILHNVQKTDDTNLTPRMKGMDGKNRPPSPTPKDLYTAPSSAVFQYCIVCMKFYRLTSTLNVRLPISQKWVLHSRVYSQFYHFGCIRMGARAFHEFTTSSVNKMRACLENSSLRYCIHNKVKYGDHLKTKSDENCVSLSSCSANCKTMIFLLWDITNFRFPLDVKPLVLSFCFSFCLVSEKTGRLRC